MERVRKASGFQSGAALNLPRAYAGTYFQTASLAVRVHFHPAIGSGLKRALVVIMFECKLPVGRLSG